MLHLQDIKALFARGGRPSTGDIVQKLAADAPLREFLSTQAYNSAETCFDQYKKQKQWASANTTATPTPLRTKTSQRLAKRRRVDDDAGEAAEAFRLDFGEDCEDQSEGDARGRVPGTCLALLGCQLNQRSLGLFGASLSGTTSLSADRGQLTAL